MLSRRAFLGSAAIAATAQGMAPFALRAGSVVYLLGEEVLEDHWHVERRLSLPHGRSPEALIRKEQPWEGMGPYTYGTVLRDPADGTWKCWYTVFNDARYRAREPFPYRIAYAVSEDGVSWKKPSLGLVEDSGSRENSLVPIGGRDAEAVDVTIAPASANAPARYIGMVLDRGVRIFLSDDGLRWKESDANPIDARHSDCHNSLCWDEHRRRWLAHIRPPVYAGPGHDKRRIAVMESPDLRKWTSPVTVLAPDEQDPPEFYSMPVFQRGNLFFGFLQIYDRRKESLEIELTYSTDAYRWHRLPGRPLFLPTGPAGSFDSGMVTTADSVVLDGDRMFTYYGGWNGDHKSNDREGGIGRVESVRDRFISWHASAQEDGFLLTRPAVLEAGSISANAKLGGKLHAAICDDQGNALPGFSFDDCTAITGDQIKHPLAWKGDLRTLRGRTVRIRVRFRDGDFFALELA